MAQSHLDTPAGKSMSSSSIGNSGALKSTPTGGFSAQKPTVPTSKTPITVRIARGGK